MPQQKRTDRQGDAPKRPAGHRPSAGDAKRHGTPQPRGTPKPERSSEYEGARSRKPTGNPDIGVKTETSSSSGQ